MISKIWSAAVLLAMWAFLAHSSDNLPSWVYQIRSEHLTYALIAVIVLVILYQHTQSIPD